MTDTTDKVAFAAAELNAASDALASAAAEVDALRAEVARQTGIAVNHCARADAAEQMVCVDALAAERDAAIAARDEAVAAFERSGAKGLVAMAQRDAAERARDEVGIQLAAAQAEIARWSPVIQYASNVHHCYREGYDLVKPMAALGGALRALDAVPGDALAPRITAALEASGIDTSNVKGVE